MGGPVIKQMTARQLAEARAAGHAPTVLDVREPVELQLAALPNVVHIPMREVPRRLDELDPDAPLVVLCHHGVRSMSVAQYLVERDFDDVANLTGGIDAWARDVGGVPRY